MSAGIKDWTAKHNATWAKTVVWYDETDTRVNLDGFTAHMQVRTDPDSEVVLELTSNNDTITITSPGEIALFVDADVITALELGSYKYDLFMITSDDIRTDLLEGKFKVLSSITKEVVV